jgi:malonate transporter
MSHVLTTIAPVFLIIGLGAVLKAKTNFDESFWRAIERLTFYGLFPSLLFVKVAGADVDWSTALPVSAAIVGGVAAAGLVGWPLKALPGIGKEKFVAMYQGGFRVNTYVGIAVVLGSFDDSAAGPLSIAILAMSLAINPFGAWAHLHWLETPGRRKGMMGLFVDCLRNPLIFACLAGLALNMTGIGLPPILGPTLELLSRAALPMGLMAVGAGLSLSSVRGDSLPAALSCIVKLVVMPAATYVAGRWLGLDGAALAVAVIFSGLPTSSTSYVISRTMGSDPQLMAAIITLSHLAAIVSLPVLVTLLH